MSRTEQHIDLPTLEGYDLVDRIGRGGMGVVYEAFQQSTGRRVAIKFLIEEAIEPGSYANPAARRRFEREIELIARLQHPGVASIIDSGVQRGRYYYVMEFVEGLRLDQAVLPGKVDRCKALDLMTRICAAVDYAHQRGVLHRDLKPSNILVDATGQPHVLDFGLGKAFDSEDPRTLELTLSEKGQLIGTLGYMSPEQARGDIGRISVRADVYSLGAIAYELICGVLPCSIVGPMSEVLERIENSPRRAPSAITKRRDLDLDAILLKAVEVEPARRYDTAGAFGEDIRRYLQNETIAARPIGPVSRVGRWIRRRRAMAGVIGLSTILILILGVTSIIRITSERDRFKEVYGVLLNMFATVDPDQLMISNFSARDFLDHVTAKLDHMDLKNAPDEEAQIRETLGIIYIKMGRYENAESQFRKALGLRERNLKAPHAQLASSKLWLAASLWNEKRFAEAEPLDREALAMRRALFDETSVEVAEAQHHLAACLDEIGAHQEAEQLFRCAVRTFRARLKSNPPDLRLVAMHGFLGRCLLRQRRFDEARKELEEGLELTRASCGEKHWRTARSLKSLAEYWKEIGDFNKAGQLARQALAIQLDVLGKDTNETRETEKFLNDVEKRAND